MVSGARGGQRRRAQARGREAGADDQHHAADRRPRQRVVEQPDAVDERERDAQVLQARVGQRLADRVGARHQHLRGRSRTRRWPSSSASPTSVWRTCQPWQQGHADAGQEAADREIEHHADLGLAGAAQRRDLQVGERRQHARGQADDAGQQLVARDRRLQHQRDADEADQHRGHEARVDALRAQHDGAADQEQRHPDGGHVVERHRGGQRHVADRVEPHRRAT